MILYRLYHLGSLALLVGVLLSLAALGWCAAALAARRLWARSDPGLADPLKAVAGVGLAQAAAACAAQGAWLVLMLTGGYGRFNEVSLVALLVGSEAPLAVYMGALWLLRLVPPLIVGAPAARAMAPGFSWGRSWALSLLALGPAMWLEFLVFSMGAGLVAMKGWNPDFAIAALAGAAIAVGVGFGARRLPGLRPKRGAGPAAPAPLTPGEGGG